MTYQKVSASGLVMNTKGQILLVKRADDDDFLPGVYELPGGGTDYLEDPVEGLKRELVEECGLKVNVEHPLTAFSFVMKHEGVDKHTVEIIYLCKLKNNQKVKLSFEHSDYKWLTFEDAQKMSLTDFMMNLINNIQKHPLLLK